MEKIEILKPGETSPGVGGFAPDFGPAPDTAFDATHESERPDRVRKLNLRILQTGFVGAFYFLWALGDLPDLAASPLSTSADVMAAALFRILAVVVPTVLLVWRKNLIAGGVLVGLALFLSVGAVSYGDVETAFWHGLTAVLFARGALAARALQKHTR